MEDGDERKPEKRGGGVGGVGVGGERGGVGGIGGHERAYQVPKAAAAIKSHGTLITARSEISHGRFSPDLPHSPVVYGAGKGHSIEG